MSWIWPVWNALIRGDLLTTGGLYFRFGFGLVLDMLRQLLTKWGWKFSFWYFGFGFGFGCRYAAPVADKVGLEVLFWQFWIRLWPCFICCASC